MFMSIFEFITWFVLFIPYAVYYVFQNLNEIIFSLVFWMCPLCRFRKVIV